MNFKKYKWVIFFDIIYLKMNNNMQWRRKCMIKVIAKNFIKMNQVDNFEQSAIQLIEETRKEEGNISYALYEDINNKQILTFIEEWENEEALNKHMNSVHFKRIVPEFNKFQERESEINIYRVRI